MLGVNTISVFLYVGVRKNGAECMDVVQLLEQGYLTNSQTFADHYINLQQWKKEMELQS